MVAPYENKAKYLCMTLDTKLRWKARKKERWEKGISWKIISQDSQLAKVEKTWWSFHAWEMTCCNPVSYTHLDVYKRQMLYCVYIIKDFAYFWNTFVEG